MLAGGCWQLCDRSRRAGTSGIFITICFIAWGVFAVISLVVIVPQMRTEESLRSRIRSLSIEEIAAIEIEGKGSRLVVVDEESIGEFCETARDAELFYSSHEGSIKEYAVSIKARNLVTERFEARIPERHVRDLALRLRGTGIEIILPGGGWWIESVLSRTDPQAH